jgi:hypothetical protein
MANRYAPKTAQKTAGDLITGGLWNAGVLALSSFALNVPAFRGHQGSGQALTSGTWAVLALDTTDLDTDSGHSNVTNNSRYTCQVAGWYYVEGYFATGSGGTAARFECSIAKNGTIVGGSAQFLMRQNDLQALMSGTLVQLAVGDYVEVWGRHNSGVGVGTFVGPDLDCCMNLFWVHT